MPRTIRFPRAVAVALTATIAAAMLAPSPALASQQTVVPSADATVTSAYPARNTGGALTLRVDASPTVRSYLRFRVPALDGTLTRATLQIAAKSRSSAGFRVNAVSSNAWTESGITYQTAPVPGALVGSSGPVSSGQWASVDVTGAVSGSSDVSFALTGASATAIALASRESTQPPRLVLETAPSAPPPAADPQPAFPIRAAFFYPWYPETWTVNGTYTHYHPALGYYSSVDQSVIASQIRALEYAKIQAAISSWWGPGTRSDTRLPLLLSATAGHPLRWAIYYENESTGDPSASQIAYDLQYVESHYGSDPSYLRVGGRPVVFVYADAVDGCGMVDRWRKGNAAANAYVVLKVFNGYRLCAGQPDSWHQYGPASAASNQAGYSYSISPGFWRADEASPRLARDLVRWRQNVRDMVASSAPWQLVTTFNEWGEGTAVEDASEWETTSGFGAYLDALHDDGAATAN
jgi:hypothetical protein